MSPPFPVICSSELRWPFLMRKVLWSPSPGDHPTSLFHTWQLWPRRPSTGAVKFTWEDGQQGRRDVGGASLAGLRRLEFIPGFDAKQLQGWVCVNSCTEIQFLHLLIWYNNPFFLSVQQGGCESVWEAGKWYTGVRWDIIFTTLFLLGKRKKKWLMGSRNQMVLKLQNTRKIYLFR